jgi:hypothetical protein
LFLPLALPLFPLLPFEPEFELPWPLLPFDLLDGLLDFLDDDELLFEPEALAPALLFDFELELFLLLPLFDPLLEEFDELPFPLPLDTDASLPEFDEPAFEFDEPLFLLDDSDLELPDSVALFAESAFWLGLEVATRLTSLARLVRGKTNSPVTPST